MNSRYKAVSEIIRTGHWLTESVTKALKEYDIYEPQFNVLRILKGAKGEALSVNTILDRMLSKSSNVTRIIDKLEAKELVQRTCCPKDRRKMDVLITKKGSELLLKLNDKVKQLHQPLMNNLTEKEYETLEQLIVKFKGEKT